MRDNYYTATMKCWLIFLLLLLPHLAAPQSKKSNLLFQKGSELFDSAKYDEALPYFIKSDSLDKKKLKPSAPNYHRAELQVANCLAKIAFQYDRKNDYPEAIRLQTMAVEIFKKVLGAQNRDYAKSLHHLAWFYDDIGNYHEAIRLQTIAVQIQKNYLGEYNQDHASSLNNLAIYYGRIGNYAEAIGAVTQAKEIFKKTAGENSPSYASALSNLAGYYREIGNYAEAIRIGTLAMEIRKSVLGEKHASYAISLNNLAGYYNETGNNSEAIRLGNIALQIRRDAIGEDHPDYAKSLSRLAGYYDDSGNHAEAIRLGTLAMEKRKKILGEQHPYYAMSLSNLAGYYFKIFDYTEAISLATTASQLRRNILGDDHPWYAESLKQLATFHLVISNYDKAAQYYRQAYTRINAFILKNFASMTSKERANFWKKHSDFFGSELTYAAYKHPDTTLTAIAYDSQVFSKGLLLNAELEIQNLISQSGDTAFENRYYKIKQDRAILDGLYQTAVSKRFIDADSLAKVIDREERLLVESSKALGNYTQKLSISWHDVQKHLKNNDLAIEFAAVKDTSAKQIVYVALVLKNGMKSPEIVKLFNIYDFFDIEPKEYYTATKLYDLVWKPLEPYLQDVKTVYFSPAGWLHTIGIEYLRDGDGNIFAEKYDTYRLSSTRELAMSRTINPSRKATTYGGIKYELSEQPDTVRGGMSYLASTKLESASIATLLRSANYNVTALSDTAATEESFKKLSGTDIKILHIGTHGFYESEDNMENVGYQFYASASQQTNEDRSLSRSGLLFAGANSALDPKRMGKIPDGADDGVLTAKEISRLDFQGLDLVVLSACQTGLGEITGEGVFGLQRGFKKAGAQTIVMSLWKVADESTQLLMVEFFKNLTAGQSKRAAFLAAQKTVREKYPNPLHWAAFVMVDGM